MDQLDICRTKYTAELQRFFGNDQRRIDHAHKVLAYSEKIMDGEGIEGRTRYIVTITALLHDVGIKISEQKYKSSAGTYQELEGPPIVREIMARLGEELAIIERVAYIVGGHHTPAKNNGLDFQIIWEADLLVNIEEENLAANPEVLQKLLDKNFKTQTGLRIMRQQYNLAE